MLALNQTIRFEVLTLIFWGTSNRMGKEMSVCEGDTIRFDIQFSSGDKSQLEFFHEGKRVQENDKDGVGISFANDVASLTIQGSAYSIRVYAFDRECQISISRRKWRSHQRRNLEILFRATFLISSLRSASLSLTCRGRGRSRTRAPTSAS